MLRHASESTTELALRVLWTRDLKVREGDWIGYLTFFKQQHPMVSRGEHLSQKRKKNKKSVSSVTQNKMFQAVLRKFPP